MKQRMYSTTELEGKKMEGTPEVHFRNELRYLIGLKAPAILFIQLLIKMLIRRVRNGI